VVDAEFETLDPDGRTSPPAALPGNDAETPPPGDPKSPWRGR
jgi:hypothetical protein